MKDEELLTFNDTSYSYVDPTYDRTYVNPEISQAEQLQFIDTLRDIQAQNNAQINQQTYALGTQVPSNLGGLTGSEGVWQARYQTPQMNATVANLQNTARQTALNTALSNQQTMWKNRYDQAKRALERAQHNYSTTSGGGGDGDKDPDNLDKQNTSTSAAGTVTGHAGETVVASPYTGDDGNPIFYVYNSNGELVRIDGKIEKDGKLYNSLKKKYPSLID